MLAGGVVETDSGAGTGAATVSVAATGAGAVAAGLHRFRKIGGRKSQLVLE